MIHQHILAAPRPGMSEFDFQDYWRYVHALKFARKIPQIKKYKLDLRIDIDNQPHELNFGGIAEIWIENEKDQLDSLKSPEFLEGAKLDEPKWAASWQSLVLDTESKEIKASESKEDKDFPEYKTLLFMKRKSEMEIDDFREFYTKEYSENLRQYDVFNKITCCLTKRTLYKSNIEPAFDSITHLSFKTLIDLKKFSSTKLFKELVDPCANNLTDPWGLVTSSVRSDYIIGPEFREYLNN